MSGRNADRITPPDELGERRVARALRRLGAERLGTTPAGAAVYAAHINAESRIGLGEVAHAVEWISADAEGLRLLAPCGRFGADPGPLYGTERPCRACDAVLARRTGAEDHGG